MAASNEREVDSDLGGCLEDVVPVHNNSPTPVVQVVVLDEAAIVKMFRPKFADSFLFTIQMFLPYITPQLQHVSRLVAWDEHIADSLKAEGREMYPPPRLSALTTTARAAIINTYHTDVPRDI